MKLFAWVIIGFRKADNNNVTWNQWLYYTTAPEMGIAVVGEIDKKAKFHFPQDEGWFNVSHNIIEIPNVFSGATDTPPQPT